MYKGALIVMPFFSSHLFQTISNDPLALFQFPVSPLEKLQKKTVQKLFTRHCAC